MKYRYWWYVSLLFTARQWRCGKIMFSQVSVIMFGGVGGGGTVHHMNHGVGGVPPSFGIHYSSPWDTPYPLWYSYHPPWDTLPLLMISGGDHWRPVQICSFEDLFYPPRVTSSGGNWNMKHIRFLSGWYASCLNAVLLNIWSVRWGKNKPLYILLIWGFE